MVTNQGAHHFSLRIKKVSSNNAHVGTHVRSALRLSWMLETLNIDTG